MTEKEQKRLKMIMKNLDLTEEEAKNLLEEDKRIDRMRKFSDIQSDMTEEQKKVSKKARQTAKTNIGQPPKKTPSERVKKTDNEKQTLVSMFYNLLAEQPLAEQVEIVNDQKLITFIYNGRKFKLDLIASRK